MSEVRIIKIIKNPNNNEYEKITMAVKNNDGYCPCMIYKDETTKCICKSFREQDYEGQCHCGRFVKVKE